MTCDGNLDRCVKGIKEGTKDDVSFGLYAKGCGISSQCDPDTADFCKSDTGKLKKCEINCCSDDLCNGGRVPMVSTIVLLTGALVALLR